MSAGVDRMRVGKMKVAMMKVDRMMSLTYDVTPRTLETTMGVGKMKVITMMLTYLLVSVA